MRCSIFALPCCKYRARSGVPFRVGGKPPTAAPATSYKARYCIACQGDWETRPPSRMTRRPSPTLQRPRTNPPWLADTPAMTRRSPEARTSVHSRHGHGSTRFMYCFILLARRHRAPHTTGRPPWPLLAVAVELHTRHRVEEQGSWGAAVRWGAEQKRWGEG